MERLLLLGIVTSAFGGSDMNGYANPEALLNELNHLERLIQWLSGKRDRLVEALDAATKPAIPPVQCARVVYRG